MTRKVRICTISMDAVLHTTIRAPKEAILREAEEKMKLGALDKPDLFLFPEVFLLQDTAEAWRDPANPDEEGNDTFQRMAAAARSYHAYIAAALLTREQGRVYNSVVLFDRNGQVVYTYHKTHPTTTELEAGVAPGVPTPACYDADFGRLGVAICFDLNFQPLFKHYYDQGIELLLFPSYFPGGLLLQTWSYLYMFHAVSSHAQGFESVFVNNLGMVEARAGRFTQALTHEFELDSVVVPYYGNHFGARAAKEKYGPALELDIHRPEGDMIVRYRGTETTAEDILREFGMKTRPEFYNHENLL